MYLAILAKEAKFDSKFYHLKSCWLISEISAQNARPNKTPADHAKNCHVNFKIRTTFYYQLDAE